MLLKVEFQKKLCYNPLNFLFTAYLCNNLLFKEVVIQIIKHPQILKVVLINYLMNYF